MQTTETQMTPSEEVKNEVLARASTLKAMFKKFPLTRQAVALSYAAMDPGVSLAKKIGIAAALGYVAMPFDLIPDFIPVIGYLDDLAAIAIAVKLCGDIIKEEHLVKADAFLGNPGKLLS